MPPVKKGFYIVHTSMLSFVFAFGLKALIIVLKKSSQFLRSFPYKVVLVC